MFSGPKAVAKKAASRSVVDGDLKLVHYSPSRVRESDQSRASKSSKMVSVRMICDGIGDARSQRGPAWTRIANDDGQHASRRFIGDLCNRRAHHDKTGT